jgi:hypothetical protein
MKGRFSPAELKGGNVSFTADKALQCGFQRLKVYAFPERLRICQADRALKVTVRYDFEDGQAGVLIMGGA